MKLWKVIKLRGNTPDTYGKLFGQIVCNGKAISPPIDYDVAIQITEAHNAEITSR